MIKTVFKTVFKENKLFSYSQISARECRAFATFRPQDFSMGRSKGQDTHNLSTKFARHIIIKHAENAEVNVKYDIKYADYFPVTNVRNYVNDLVKISTEQLPRMVVFTSVYKCRAEFSTICQVINNLDNECTKRLDKMSYPQIIELMNAFKYCLPTKLVQLDFYRNGIRKLVDAFDETKSANEFVELCFYLGMWKKNQFSSEKMDHLMKSYLTNYMSTLGTIDFAIICHAAFKAGILVDNQTFQERIVKEVMTMELPDISLLTTFINSCYHHKIESTEIIEKLKSWRTNNQINETNIRGLYRLFKE